MHADLSPHLHTESCNLLIKDYQDCHANHPVLRFMGYCNEFDRIMKKCLKAERKTRQRANFLESEKVRNEIRERVRKAENQQ